MCDGQDDVDVGEGAVLLEDDGLVGCVELALVLKRDIVDLSEDIFDERPFILEILADFGDLDKGFDERRELLNEGDELVLKLYECLDDLVSGK